MGSDEERKKFVEQVRKACRIAARLRELGVRPYGVVRIDSACGVTDWAQDPENNQAKVAETFRQACAVAEDLGERLAAEGEICWGGMHSWRKMLDLLERVDRPRTLGFQADMAHTLLYLLGYNAPEDALLPADWDWSDPVRLDSALVALTAALRPWTIDFHVAQNDGTVKGSGTHDKTGHHCLPGDPQGKLDIARHAGYWLRRPTGEPTRALRHICWDGCMFPNAVMMQAQTWNDILKTMVAVRDAHGWSEAPTPAPVPPVERPVMEVSEAPAPAIAKAAKVARKAPVRPKRARKQAARRVAVRRAPKLKVRKVRKAGKARKTGRAKTGSPKKARRKKTSARRRGSRR